MEISKALRGTTIPTGDRISGLAETKHVSSHFSPPADLIASWWLFMLHEVSFMSADSFWDLGV